MYGNLKKYNAVSDWDLFPKSLVNLSQLKLGSLGLNTYTEDLWDYFLTVRVGKEEKFTDDDLTARDYFMRMKNIFFGKMTKYS